MTIKFKDSVTAKGYSVIEINLENIKRSGLAVEGSRWCCWSATWEAGRDKPAKIPCDATGGRLSVAKPDDWLTFDEAAAGYDPKPHDGIGFLMGAGDCLVGLDLDKCLKDDGTPEDGRKAIVEEFMALGGYIERSPSGLGLRQFLLGVTPDDYVENNPEWGFEAYDSEATRYLTVTGQSWPVGAEVGKPKRNQVELEVFISRWGKRVPDSIPLEFDREKFGGVQRSAVEVLKLLKTYNRRGKVTRLLSGDTADYGGHSEADAALCFDAAYFCRNPLVIDEILRSSGLMRPKWDERRGRETYGGLTIRRALKAQTRNFDADKAEKMAEGQAVKADVQKLAAKGAENLVGGLEGLTTAKGAIKHNLYALTELVIRDKRLLGCLYWDTFGDMPIVTRSFRVAFCDVTAPDTVGAVTDCHLSALVAWFGREWGIALRPKEEWAILKRWSQIVRRNPIAEKLNGLVWDGKTRVNGWLVTYASAKVTTDDGKDITDYVKAIGRHFLIAAIGRALKPGCKVDTMLVLEGAQGFRKSSMARALADPFGEGYFRDGFNLGSGKDDRIALKNRWIVEWAELSGMGRKDASEIKNFMTQQVDPYRNVYGAIEQDHPRTAVFIGTTNDSQYLSDPTGNRRFLPVKVGRINLDALKRDVLQIWAEAMVMYRQNPKWWFDDDLTEDMRILRMAEAEQFRRMASSLWDEVAVSISERLIEGELPLLDSSIAAWRGDHFSVEQLRHWIGGNAEGAAKIDDQAWIKVTKSLRVAGWENTIINGRRRWRLTADNRHYLCEKFNVDSGPKKPMRVIAAENAAAKALAAAMGQKVVQTQK